LSPCQSCQTETLAWRSVELLASGAVPHYHPQRSCWISAPRIEYIDGLSTIPLFPSPTQRLAPSRICTLSGDLRAGNRRASSTGTVGSGFSVSFQNATETPSLHIWCNEMVPPCRFGDDSGTRGDSSEHTWATTHRGISDLLCVFRMKGRRLPVSPLRRKVFVHTADKDCHPRLHLCSDLGISRFTKSAPVKGSGNGFDRPDLGTSPTRSQSLRRRCSL